MFCIFHCMSLSPPYLMPRYFILFDAVIYKIVFVISFQIVHCQCTKMQLIFVCWLYDLLLWWKCISSSSFVFFPWWIGPFYILDHIIHEQMHFYFFFFQFGWPFFFFSYLIALARISVLYQIEVAKVAILALFLVL